MVKFFNDDFIQGLGSHRIMENPGFCGSQSGSESVRVYRFEGSHSLAAWKYGWREVHGILVVFRVDIILLVG